MELIRTKKGTNDFVITGLTAGKLYAIKNALTFQFNNHGLGPVGNDLLCFLEANKVDTIEDFADTHTQKKISIKA